VLFESRFSIGTLVSFFYPVKTNAFLVIIADVEFATVQDINMMTLMCVDQPRVEIGKEEEPDDKDKNEDEDDTIEVGKDDLPDVVKSQLKRNQWYEQEIEIFKYTTQSPYALGGKDSMWFNVVHLKQKPEIDLKAWTEGQPTEAQILEAVMKWTRERHGEATWQKWMNRRSYFSNPDGGKSRENTAKQWPGMPDVLEGIGARNRVEVPWLYPEDVIIIRIPFRPEHLYDEKDKVTIKRR
jgi:signal peptidase I